MFQKAEPKPQTELFSGAQRGRSCAPDLATCGNAGPLKSQSSSLKTGNLPVAPHDGYAGKLGFHWYEATFGVLQRGHADAAEREESDDDDIESLHWNSDTEERLSENDSSEVDSGDDLLDLPWDGDSRSVQSSEGLEPGAKVQRHNHFLENMGQSVQAMAERAGHDRIEDEDVVWFIHRYLGTADPFKLWALADELLPAELRNQIYPATPFALASKDA
ncbi:hypothetical protein HPB52_015267 [Rhipicephalus sanguineus]|uniref:CENP-T/Histone H4 histone fold domain-containing protein n=1 Tax=Rhipicephalus sanguineus TaxID=34632 RepID=A0A9D4PLR9_RHISA|nr:hypothetical protein HPB52_015267 [Rhipicephalus sanguineus]